MRVTLCDVGPRDGLQNEPETLAPQIRAELVRRLAASRLPRIEAVSFVSDERVPQMAGAEEVVAAVGELDAELSGLVLNERGWERLAATPERARQFRDFGYRFIAVGSDIVYLANGAKAMLAIAAAVYGPTPGKDCSPAGSRGNPSSSATRRAQACRLRARA